MRWGIIGTGKIATSFRNALAFLGEDRSYAVASRSEEKAKDFAAGGSASFQAVYGSYGELLNDSAVQCVYIATPHPQHYELARLALDAGKHVLCEKPLTLNAQQAANLFEVAANNNRLLMEAVWTRFLPAVVYLEKEIRSGKLGDLLSMRATFNVRLSQDPKARLLNPSLGGGALLDLGVYPLHVAQMFFGTPTKVSAAVRKSAATGVDVHSDVTLHFDDGRFASLQCASDHKQSNDAWIVGTKGSVQIDEPFWRPSRIVWHIHEQEPDAIAMPYESTGLNYEVVHFEDCIRQKRIESPVVTPEATLGVLSVTDTIRAEHGITYPAE